ncbi:MAG: dTDP-4-dehydrorhamnose 3,5-epimerase [Bacteroidetes bacterium HGW-Bacteroidetes-6]|nr:MAG: dTDP-4-dehydrorhamnose 3,5-epimerase [Bacteroidetes bacterium HGW-Bacteroidetes-6]
MQVTKFGIEGLLLIEPRVFVDDRGYFKETFHAARYAEAGIDGNFVQDNESMSGKYIVRGLHLQDPPFAQGKLIRVIAGSIFDVAVDVRVGSATYGKFQSVVLSAQNHLQFWIPPGFAHGFMALEDNTIINYKCTGFYNSSAERTIMWNDPDLAIPWPGPSSVVSSKDNRGEFLRMFQSKFNLKL